MRILENVQEIVKHVESSNLKKIVGDFLTKASDENLKVEIYCENGKLFILFVGDLEAFYKNENHHTSN